LARKSGRTAEDLVREAVEEKLATEREPCAGESVSEALAELDQLRVGNRLNGLTIRQLIEEGRRL
jgi:hypothetical protein